MSLLGRGIRRKDPVENRERGFPKIAVRNTSKRPSDCLKWFQSRTECQTVAELTASHSTLAVAAESSALETMNAWVPSDFRIVLWIHSGHASEKEAASAFKGRMESFEILFVRDRNASALYLEPVSLATIRKCERGAAKTLLALGNRNFETKCAERMLAAREVL